MATKGRSPTARRVWLWLDASAPREARALATYDRMQETLPPRVRATLLREAFCAALEQVAAELDENEQVAPPAPAVQRRQAEALPPSPEPAESEVVAPQADPAPTEPPSPEKPITDDTPMAGPGDGGGEAKAPGLMW